MTFKNKRGEVHWYVIGIVLAIIILLITLFGPVRKIMGAQDDVSDRTKDTCQIIAEGTCRPSCNAGEEKSLLGICPESGDTQQDCCVAAG